MIEIFGKGTTRSMRALWAARESGLEHNYIEVDLMKGEHQKDDFKKMNPFGRVPVLKDGDFVLWESAAIITYLGDLAPETKLVPQTPKERGLYNKWMHFANCEIDSVLFNIEKHSWRYPEAERLPQIIRMSIEELQVPLDIVSNHLSENAFLLGDQFTMVDILMGHCLNWARFREAFSDNTTLNDYTKRLSQREHYPRELYKK